METIKCHWRVRRVEKGFYIFETWLETPVIFRQWETHHSHLELDWGKENSGYDSRRAAVAAAKKVAKAKALIANSPVLEFGCEVIKKV